MDDGEPELQEDESVDDSPKQVGVHTPFLQRWDRDLPEDRRVYGLKMIFAGCEAKKVRDGLHRIGVRHILVSFFYLRKWLESAPVQEIAEDLGRFDFVFLDSGGFTFLTALQEGKDLGMDVKTYTEQYYAALPRIGHLFAGCAEVDVSEKLTEQFMEDEKDKLWAKGVPIVPVIQGHRREHLEALGWMRKYPYIALGSAMINSSQHMGDVLAVIQMGKENGVLFHGFGATDSGTMLKSQFYSCDSTSWTSGSRYGTTMVFQNGRIRHYDKDHKDVRKRFKRRFEENGVIWEDIEADKGFEVDMMNALAWKQLSDYVKYSAGRSYWLTAEERDKALDFKSKAFNAEGLMDRTKSIERAQFRRLAVVSDPDQDDRGHETLHCDSCHLNGRCPRYKPAQSCGYDVNIQLNSTLDMQKALQRVLEVEYGRVMTAVLFEKMEGGVLDANLSNELSRFVMLSQSVKEIFDPREELTIKAKGGQGSIATMLASVFAPKGSGSTSTQRAAARLEEGEGRTVIDMPVQEEVEVARE